MRPPILVVGVGSPHGDDRVGWEVVRRLARAADPAVEAVALAAPIDLVGLLDRRRALVVIDAARAAGPPGAVLPLRWPDDRLGLATGPSTHGLGVAEALALAGTLGRLPETVLILAVAVADGDGDGDGCAAARMPVGMSPLLRRRVPGLCREVDGWIRRAVAPCHGPGARS